jgi:Calcineurin-like phosphoesterase
MRIIHGMRICVISDTHSYHRKIVIPDDIDVIIHCGDISGTGQLPIIEDFADWMGNLPIPEKIAIAGNHDRSLDPKHGNSNIARYQKATSLLRDAGITYLQDSGTEIDGHKIYGSAWQPRFGIGWAWNADRGKDIAEKWAAIPSDAEWLITHGPPYGILDNCDNGHVGCKDLLNRVAELPKLTHHFFGHIHPGAGMIKAGHITFVNGAICTDAYKPTNPPIVIDIVKPAVK